MNVRAITRREGGGQSLVEFALVLPIFLVLIFAVIDGGRVVFAYNQMSQVTRDVARAASVDCLRTTPKCDQTSGTIAESIASQAAGYQAPVTWTVSCVNPTTGLPPTGVAGDSCNAGYLVRVSINSTMTLFTPIASSFGPITLGSQTEQEILN